MGSNQLLVKGPGGRRVPEISGIAHVSGWGGYERDGAGCLRGQRDRLAGKQL